MIEFVIKNLPPSKVLRQMASLVNLPNNQRRFLTSSSQTLPKIRKEGTLPKAFYEASITLTPYLAKDTSKEEKYRVS